MMNKLKLGPLEDDKPVKGTLKLPAAVHRDLMAYSDVLAMDATPFCDLGITEMSQLNRHPRQRVFI
jgi:hypothetical protein